MQLNSDKNRLINSYFEAFNNQETYKLENLFTDDITLKDWLINVSGKEKVIDTIKEIFKQNNSLKINIVNVAFKDDIFYCEIDIDINNNEKLEVVDVIKIRNDKIYSIKAFKC